MSGITRLLAKELSSALGITDNPKFNPMFKQTDEVMADVADPRDPTVARFYSPLESALDEAPIGKEGTRGENVEAFVRKRAPKVTKGEMEFRGLGLEPGELYTAESAKESLGALEVKAIKKGSRYRSMQRQDSLQDKEINYAEIGLDAADDLGYTTHFGASNLAHARYSVREPSAPKESGDSLFSSDAIAAAKKQNDKSREILVYMPINDFLKAAKSIAGEPLEASQTKLKNTMGLLESNTPFSSIPSLTFKNKGDGTGKVVGHEGRHRAMAINALGLNERGTSQIPVILRSEAGEGPSIRWGQQSNPDSFDYVDKLPTKLISEEGKGTIPMPAHARPEIVRGRNNLYILIEELQSDPLQNVVDDVASYTKKTSEEMDAEVSEILDQFEFIIESEGSGYPDKAIKDLKSYIYDTVIPTRKNKTLTDSQKKDIFKKALDDIGVKPNIITPQGSLSHVASEIVGREFEFEGHAYLPDLSDMLFDTVETGLGKMETVTTRKDLPIQSITDSIRMSLQAIIADAKAKGINEIVLPPVEKLAEKRFSSDEVASKITKGSAFYNTYVAAYQKALKQLKGELGEQVKIGKKPLNYTIYDKGFRRSTETVQGTLLDISNLTIDPKNTKLRFNTGGLVQRRTK